MRSSKERPPRKDRDLGIHTAGRVLLDGLTILGPNRAHGSPYEPTPFGVLEDMLLDLAIEPARFTFIDLGSGKGRILCLAAGMGFRSVVGVEFSRELHEIACRNIAALAPSKKRMAEPRSLHLDAEDFRFPPEPLVVFLFNPFEAPLLHRVLENLRTSWEQKPREIYLFYYMPVHEDLLHRAPWLSRRSGRKDWLIMAANPARQPPLMRS